jgi:hypothetical protein
VDRMPGPPLVSPTVPLRDASAGPDGPVAIPLP